MASNQHQVAPDIERRRFPRQPYRVVEGLPVGHHRGRCQDAAAMRFHNPLVHIRREPKVIRIDNQLFSSAQNIFSWIVRNFLGLARTSFISKCISPVAAFSESKSCGLVSNCPTVPCPALILSTNPVSLSSSATARW